jgi:hypothetical protein
VRHPRKGKDHLGGWPLQAGCNVSRWCVTLLLLQSCCNVDLAYDG